MPDVSERLAKLGAERRRLLERLLQENHVAPSPAAAAPPPALTFVPDQAECADRPVSDTVKAGFRRFYSAVSEQLDSTEVGQYAFFLNYGYSPDLHLQQAVVKLPPQFMNKNSVQLVLELIGDYDIREKRILDVGCGRGGTAFVLKEFFHPASVNGVDLCPQAIDFCRRRHKYGNVRFDVADAEHLSFQNGAFDVVTNVESSHSYPNVTLFYDGVSRVLAPGGVFLYTDCLQSETLAEALEHLALLGFAMERETDITSNVLKSCDEVARARVAAFHASNDPDLMANFLAVPGSEVYEQMKSRRWRYMIYRFRKPAARD
jgi:SAM-dependent methyltransferase